MDSAINGVSNLSVSAKPFVPNVHAREFVPTFGGSVAVADSLPQQLKEEKATSSEIQSLTPEDNEPTDNWEDNAEEEEEIEETTNTEGKDEDNEDVEEEDMEEEEEEESNLKQNGTETPPLSKPVKKSKPAMPESETNEKENINIIFIGHVDAGKSTIGGQLLYLTDQVDKRTLEKYEREAKEKNRETWYLSWALDTNLEERDKGKTVECGRASFETESKHFVLLDAPGHKSFVPNMIGGAAQADVAILVISARKGEFETGFERGGQTREHAMLAKTAGVRYLIVLINKMDDSTVKWDEERYKEIIEKLNPFLKKTGFKPAEVTFMPCSGFTGANLKVPVDPALCPWYNGKSFLQHLDQLPDFEWPFNEPVRILVSDRYKDMGTIVIAKVESGTVRKGDTYTLMPNRQSVKVMSIVGSDEIEKNHCRAGENVKIKLSGVEEEEVLPGFILCDPQQLCNTGRVFDAQVVILEHKSIICAGYKCVLHVHNAVEEVTLVGLIHTIDRKTGEKSPQRPRFIKQDSVAVARFKTSNLICMENFTDFAPMGRFTLRDEGKSIAIGKILQVRHKKDQAE